MVAHRPPARLDRSFTADNPGVRVPGRQPGGAEFGVALTTDEAKGVADQIGDV